MDRVEEIRSRLETAFSPDFLDIEDQSHLHAGHVGARDGAGHFRVRIRAEALSDMNRVKRQRAVYTAVADMMQSEIHALSVVFE